MSILHCDCRILPSENEGFISWLDEASGKGFGGIGIFCDTAGQSQWKDLPSMAQDRSLRIGAISSSEVCLFDLCCQIQEQREKAIEFFNRLIGLAERVSTETDRAVVVIDAGQVPVDFQRWGGYEVRMNRLYQSVEILAGRASEKKIFLAIEHPSAGLFQSPLELREFVDTVGGSYFGICFRPDCASKLGQWQDWMGILDGRILAMRMGPMDDYQQAYESEVGRGVILYDNGASFQK